MITSLLAAALWWGVFALVFLRDRRRVRNGVLFLIAAYASLVFLANLVSEMPFGSLVVVAGAVLTLLGVGALAVFLVANGLTILRKEGRSLGNALSLLAGIAMMAAPVAAAGLVLTGEPLALVGAFALGLVSLHLGALFLVFLSASLLYQRFPRRLDATGIIIHGAGLIRGEVTPLLRSRLDRAVEERVQLLARGIDPLLVPSGGQGADEPCAEGEAMAEYLIEEAGVPADRVRAETESLTTEENLTLSHRLLDESGHHGPYLVSTSRYHAFRAALIARGLGFDDEALGGPTTFYYVPSATLREFIAVMTYRWAWNIVLIAPSVALVALLVRAVTL